MKRIFVFFISFTIMFSNISCDKFLEARLSNSVTNPTTTADLQALMDAGNNLNLGNYPFMGEGVSDDVFIGPAAFSALNEFEKSNYLWEKELHYTVVYENVFWTNPYKVIAITNTVLDELNRVIISKYVPVEQVEGCARFHRAFAYLALAQNYCKAYDSETASKDPGLPLRLDSDITALSKRASLAVTFEAIQKDLIKAIELLPIESLNNFRPNKVSAFALLARCALIMENYEGAAYYAEKVLRLNSKLLDYNNIDGTQKYPFEKNNREILFYAYANNFSTLNSLKESYVDSLLFDSYDEYDLRKELYFKLENNGYHSFRGSYLGSGSGSSFVGLSVPEILLIFSEASIRLGNIENALSSLNTLTESRFKTKKFVPFDEVDVEKLLSIILSERRKEMLFRGQRWSDLKRLNRDPRFSKTIYRKIKGMNEIIILPPNDLRYVFPFPKSVIEITGMLQNDR